MSRASAPARREGPATEAASPAAAARVWARASARYIVEWVIENSSSSSPMVCPPPARRMQCHQVGFLARAELGLLATRPPFGAGDLHALPSSHLDQVRVELADHGHGVEQQSPRLDRWDPVPTRRG